MSTIVALTNHGLVASDRIYFGNLEPDTTGIIEGAIYYVLAAGLTVDQFQFSETDGGAAFTLAADITDGIVSKAATYTAITDVAHVMAPPTAPAAATDLALTSSVEEDTDGHYVVRLDVSLVQPTSATLRHTVVTITGPVGPPVQVVIPSGQTTAAIHGVIGGALYSGVAVSYDTFGLASTPTAAATHTTAGDLTAPAVPAGLSIAGAILGLLVRWAAVADTDIDHYEVAVSSDGGLTFPTVHKTYSNVLSLTQLTAGEYDIKVRAVDRSGNASAYGSIESGTARLTDVVENSTQTVTIGPTGIEIKDANGVSLLTANGFGGSWLNFLASGLFYNAGFESGDTVDIAATQVGAGATIADYEAGAFQSHLPFWVVASSAGTIKVVTDANAPGGKALQFSGTGGQVNRIYQDLSVPSNRDSWSIFVDYIFSNMLNASDAIKFYASWRKADHSIIGSRVAISSFVGALGAGATSPYGQLFLETDGNGDGGPGIGAGIGASPPDATYLRFEIELTHQTATFTFTVGDVFATPGVFKGEYVRAYQVEGDYLIADTMLTALDAQISDDLDVGGDVTVTGTITHGGVSVITPAGAIIMYGGAAAPSGYLLCDGTSYARGTYPDLFAAISTAYGAVDGTHFTVPDLRGRFALGKSTGGTGANLGDTGGAIDHTHTGPSHTHTGPSHSHTSAAHTHTMANHTHTGPSHSHTSAAHTHGMDHDHTMSSHTHPLNVAVAATGTRFGSSAGATSNGGSGVHTSGALDGLGAAMTVTNSTTPGDTGAAGTGATGAPSTNTSDSTTPGDTGSAGTGATGASGTAATGTQNPPFQVVNYIIKT